MQKKTLSFGTVPSVCRRVSQVSGAARGPPERGPGPRAPAVALRSTVVIYVPVDGERGTLTRRWKVGPHRGTQCLRFPNLSGSRQVRETKSLCTRTVSFANPLWSRAFSFPNPVWYQTGFGNESSLDQTRKAKRWGIITPWGLRAAESREILVFCDTDTHSALL